MKSHFPIACVIGIALPLMAAAQPNFGSAPPGPQYAPGGPQGGYSTGGPQGAYPGGPPQGGYPSAGQTPGAYPPGGYNQMPPPPQGQPRTGAPGGYTPPPMQGGGYGVAPPPAGYGPAQGSMGGGNSMQAIVAAELQDFGVPPQAQLHTQLHAPTPTSIPGGQVITTDRLLTLYQQGQQNGLLVFDVLGSGFTLPVAQNAVRAAEPGSFNDNVQREFGQYLQQVTQGNKGRPMVFYCQGPQCWMSYNAALRAIRMGFTQVYWYRGGVEAWQRMQQMGAGMQQQGAEPMGGGYPQQGAGAGYPQQGAGGGYPPGVPNPSMGNRR